MKRIRKAIEKLKKYLDWHKKILERDNYTCQICKIRGGKLHVDHFPKSFSFIIKKYNITNCSEALKCSLLWDINNGRTLCYKCHKVYHKKGG